MHIAEYDFRTLFLFEIESGKWILISENDDYLK